MNANLSYTLDSLFGPPSNPVLISDFLQSSSHQNFTETEKDVSLDIADQCSVEDIRSSLQEVWSNPSLSAYLIKDHDHTTAALHSLNQKLGKSGRKAHLPDPESLGVDVAKLQKNLDSVILKSFKLNTDAVLFMRTPRNSDQNILHIMKSATNSTCTPEGLEAVCTISVYSKVPWSPSHVTRASQHAFLSSQTLRDVYAAIPCISYELPQGITSHRKENCVICIEGFAYSHQEGDHDYADKLIQQLAISSKKEPPAVTKAPTSLCDTRLSSLSLRLNEPYWLIHQGNCEHFLVVDQIRLMHPLDPRAGYPLTLQITPPILDLCRACAKVPAVWSIVGDIRLGESPCLLCGPCWRNMGPSDDSEVLVLSLPEYTYK